MLYVTPKVPKAILDRKRVKRGNKVAYQKYLSSGRMQHPMMLLGNLVVVLFHL